MNKILGIALLIISLSGFASTDAPKEGVYRNSFTGEMLVINSDRTAFYFSAGKYLGQEDICRSYHWGTIKRDDLDRPGPDPYSAAEDEYSMLVERTAFFSGNDHCKRNTEENIEILNDPNGQLWLSVYMRHMEKVETNEFY